MDATFSNSLTCLDSDHDVGIKYDLLSEIQAKPGTECMICLEDVSGPLLAHKTCALKCCKGCLLAWLDDNLSCPLCRAELRSKCRCYMTGEEEFDEEFRRILVARSARPHPTQYRVVPHLGGIRSELASSLPAGTDTSLLWTHINNDIEDTHHVLVAEDRDEAGAQTIKTEDLIRRADDFQLNQMSLQNLWITDRVLGVRWFYLTQLAVQPEIGFWTPLIPEFHCLDSISHLPLRRDVIEDRLERSNTARIPIPTPIFCDIVRSLRRLYPWEGQDEIRQIYQRAQTEGITHWGFLDVRDPVSQHSSACSDSRGFYAMPWPQHRIEEGYTHSLNLQDTSIPLSWHHDHDRAMLWSVASLFRSHSDPNFDRYTREYYGEVPTEEDNAYVNFRLMDDPSFTDEDGIELDYE